MAKARRRLSRLWPRPARRARRMLRLWLAVLAASGATWASADALVDARFVAPTDRYAHGVLGDAIEYGGLELLSATGWVRFDLPQDHVFEDLAPRLVDLDLDGAADAALVVETDVRRGAALALYGGDGKIAETPHIGRSNRWLAPVGAADLDGDGYVELAYVDRPHLAKVLRIWRFHNGVLTQIAQAPGLTNHRIGEAFITGGIRVCDDRPEVITVDAGWDMVIATSFKGAAGLTHEAIGPFTGADAMDAVLSCR